METGLFSAYEYVVVQLVYGSIFSISRSSYPLPLTQSPVLNFAQRKFNIAVLKLNYIFFVRLGVTGKGKESS